MSGEPTKPDWDAMARDRWAQDEFKRLDDALAAEKAKVAQLREALRQVVKFNNLDGYPLWLMAIVEKAFAETADTAEAAE